MKILAISNFLSSSGGNRSIMEDLSDKLTGIGYTIIRTTTKKNKIFKGMDILLTLCRSINQIDLAIIDVFSGEAFLWAEIPALILKVFKKKYILVLRGGLLPEFQIRNRTRVSLLFSGASKIITPSHYLNSFFIEIDKNIEYLPNPISIDLYPIKIIDHPKANMIWLRAFHEIIYNPILAVDTIEKVKDIKNVKLTMIGPDKGDGSFQKVKNLITEYNLHNNIYLVKGIPKNEVPTYLSKGDIFINTTNVESFGQSVLEAAACGLPIVTTNVGELAYLWQHEKDALLVPPNDPEAMAAAVRRLLTEPGLAEHLSVNARKKAEQFDWGVILPQWEKLFEEVLSTHE